MLSEKLPQKHLLSFRDKRLDSRFEKMLSSMYKNPENSIPGTFKNPHSIRRKGRVIHIFINISTIWDL